MLLTIFKPAIATRITNQLARTSLNTNPYPKTTSTLAFVPIVVNDGATINVKFAPRMGKSAIIAVLPEIFRGNAENRKKHRENHLYLHKRMSVISTKRLIKVMMKNPSII